MTRMQAEQKAASRNADRLMTSGGVSYVAKPALAGYSEWCVETWKDGKPTFREYAA